MKKIAFILWIALFGAFSKVAFAEQITVRNHTSTIIYKIFAWPSELIPRSYNVIASPLMQGEAREITIDNSYRDCEFTLQYDANSPRDLRRKGYKRKPLGYAVADICKSKGVVTFKK